MDSNVFQNQFTCSMCMNYFIDPVTIGCGHSFCLPCLCICWEGAQHPPRCPVCREISHQTNFKTNIILRTQVFLARRARPYQFLSSAEQMCEIHLKTKNFFCEEHVAHRHCSIDWIAEEYRVSNVWERSLNLDNKTWIKSGYVTLRRKMIHTEYQKVCQLLYKEEKHHLERIEKESREILQQLKESEDSMDLKGKLLRGMYEELKEMCHKPDMELLRVRTEEWKLHMPQPVDPQLSSWPITGLIDRLNQSQVEISFHNEVTNHNIRLFDDVRSVRYIHDSRYVSLNPGTSNYFASWGTQDFTSGKHYWEVIVDRSWDWAVGVCRDSWIRKTGTLVESKDTFLLVCVKEDDRYSLWTTAPISPQFIAKPVGRVGVFLDLDSRSMSFVDVARRSIIWRYPDGVFTFPVRPFFYTGHT
uniref:Tripartite motif-containing protein 43-like n=1 Tax=Equus asinus asinus TaxID=83772 RepID=A0A8C4PNH8_EQUAS